MDKKVLEKLLETVTCLGQLSNTLEELSKIAVEQCRRDVQEKTRVCAWTEDADGSWFTECGNGWIFSDGGPTANGMKGCCFCLHLLKEVPYIEEVHHA
jgi:hypothetical protein